MVTCLAEVGLGMTSHTVFRCCFPYLAVLLFPLCWMGNLGLVAVATFLLLMTRQAVPHSYPSFSTVKSPDLLKPLLRKQPVWVFMVCRFQFKIRRMACPTLSGSLSFLPRVAGHTEPHFHVVLIGDALNHYGLLFAEVEAHLYGFGFFWRLLSYVASHVRVSYTVVAGYAGDLFLLMLLMIDDQDFRWSDFPVESVTSFAGLIAHLTGVLSIRVDGFLELVGQVVIRLFEVTYFMA